MIDAFQVCDDYRLYRATSLRPMCDPDARTTTPSQREERE